MKCKFSSCLYFPMNYRLIHTLNTFKKKGECGSHIIFLLYNDLLNMIIYWFLLPLIIQKRIFQIPNNKVGS